MEMSTVLVAPLTMSCGLDAEAFRELLAQHASPTDRLQHIRVRAGPHGLWIFGFLVADSPEQARITLRRLVETTMTKTPALSLWRVV
jgi:hypothetical protein